jgi:DNA polymerase elongation subunit (family B)
VVSFDINSLYPHLIMQYNISPETRLSDKLELNIDKILDGGESEKIGSVGDMCVAANGTVYRKDFQGFLPELMDKMYADRKHYKNLMIEAKKELSLVEESIKKCSTIELLAKKRKLEFDVSKYHNFQLVRKIQLNSAYGAVGNEWFRYYSKDMAEAITCSGQLSIRWVINHINRFLNKTMKTEKDYVIASDTDSVYLCLDDLVNNVVPGADVTKTVNFLDKFCKTVLQKEIDRSFDELCTVMNAYANRMVMEREVIADRGIWTAKKHYILNVWDSEGVRNSSPKLKIMGIETSRSSTPAPVREALKQSIHIIMNGDEKQLQNQVAQFKKKFMSLKPEEISSPSSCNGLSEYKSSSTIYRKGTPIAVKGALLFNHHLKRFGVEKKYQDIREGEKVKFIYLKVPNPISDTVISFQSSIPKEFDLDRFVDYQTQYEKKFLNPLRTILDTVGWYEEERSTLDSLFA